LWLDAATLLTAQQKTCSQNVVPVARSTSTSTGVVATS